MKKIVTLLAIAAMSASIMIACSGSGSSKGPFGSLPEVYAQFEQEQEQLEEEAENIETEAEKAALMKKYDKLQEKWKTKIKKSAKALDGKVLTFAESDVIIVKEPISLQFEKIHNEEDLYPRFKVNGKAEAATDIVGIYIGLYEREHKEIVYLVGYDAEGKEVYRFRIGYMEAENRDGKAVVPAGTPIKFDSFNFYLKSQDHEAAQTLKLEVKKYQ